MIADKKNNSNKVNFLRNPKLKAKDFGQKSCRNSSVQLHQHFTRDFCLRRNFFAKKLQSQNVNLRVKCWWNWLQVFYRFGYAEVAMCSWWSGFRLEPIWTTARVTSKTTLQSSMVKVDPKIIIPFLSKFATNYVLRGSLFYFTKSKHIIYLLKSFVTEKGKA